MKIAIADITIGKRHRRDMGNLTELAESMAEVGQLQPIGVTGDYQLVWGERRLRAAKSLGWGSIEAVVDPSLADAAKHAKVERDENSCRKPFSVSEAAAVGEEIERIEREAAKKRKAQAPGEKQGHKVSSGKLPEQTRRGDSRDLAAAVVGMSGKTFEKAKKVAANAAPELLAAVDENKVSIDAAAALTTLPKSEQRQLVAAGTKAVVEAAKTVKAEQRKQHEAERLKEEPEQVVAERWVRSIHDALVPVNSVRRDLGGGKEWAKGFSKKSLVSMAAELELVIDEYSKWLKDIKEIIREN